MSISNVKRQKREVKTSFNNLKLKKIQNTRTMQISKKASPEPEEKVFSRAQQIRKQLIVSTTLI